MPNPVGRPSDYTPEVINKINEYLEFAIPENQELPTVEGIALKLGINRDTVYEWAKVHPEFSDTLEELKLRQKEILIEIGIFGGKEINATIVQLLLKVNHDMIETNKTDITSGGKPIPILSDVHSHNRNNETPEPEEEN
jgi:hypothetical protein